MDRLRIRWPAAKNVPPGPRRGDPGAARTPWAAQRRRLEPKMVSRPIPARSGSGGLQSPVAPQAIAPTHLTRPPGAPALIRLVGAAVIQENVSPIGDVWTAALAEAPRGTVSALAPAVGELCPLPAPHHPETSLLAPPEGSLVPPKAEVAPWPTPRPPTAPPRKTRVCATSTPSGAVSAACVKPAMPSLHAGRRVGRPGHEVCPLRVVRHCPLNSAAVSCGKSSGAVVASSAPCNPGPVWLCSPS